jgi:hypothetical protein
MKKMVIRLPAKYFDSCARFKGIAEYYEIVAIFNYSKTCYTEVCKVVLHEGRSIDEVPRDKDEDLCEKLVERLEGFLANIWSGLNVNPEAGCERLYERMEEMKRDMPSLFINTPDTVEGAE